MQFLDNTIKRALLEEFANYLTEANPTVELWGETFFKVSNENLNDPMGYDAEYRVGHLRNRWPELIEDRKEFPERFRLHDEWSVAEAAYNRAVSSHFQGNSWPYYEVNCEVMMGFYKLGNEAFLPEGDNKISLDISRFPAIQVDITARPNKIIFNFGPGESIELNWAPPSPSVIEEVNIGNLRLGEYITRHEVVAFTDFSFVYD
ncbi:MAG: hypothetical protein LPH21_06340 [Shewanella sp.]|nr:hypothetical protein [Shewanella sp.]